MNENLNLIEILKNCPIGTKFYSSYLGKDVFFIGIYYNCIKCEYTSQIDSLNSIIQFRKDGSLYIGGECMLFPSKNQRDWSKWHRPFVDGDVLATNSGMWIGIVEDYIGCCQYKVHAAIDGMDNLYTGNVLYLDRPATEEEKQKLFDAIKSHRYKWNDKTKILEKLIVPKFKVGDKVRNKANGRIAGTIIALYKEVYEVKSPLGNEFSIDFISQDRFELLPNKFDPKTLQPFDKVLVRKYDGASWCADLYSCYDECGMCVVCTSGVLYNFCIPYNNDTKHLVGKRDNAPEYYRYWEE